MATTENLTRVNNDVNGNPRYVIHFLQCLTDKECENLSVTQKYAFAINKMRQIGGKKYRSKSYGGGIVFQSYNTTDLVNQINNLNK